MPIEDLEEAKAAREYFQKPFKMSQAPGYKSHKPRENYTHVPYKPKTDLRRVVTFLLSFIGMGIGFALLKYVPLLAGFMIFTGGFICIVKLMPDEYDGGSYH